MPSPSTRTGHTATWLAAGILTGLTLLGGTSPAGAHAGLVSSSPAAGVRLDQEPDSVRLTFAEDIREPAYVVVTAPGGQRISDATPQVVDNQLIEPVTRAGQRGTYTVAYRVVSVDGHAVSGELSYSVASGRRVEDTTATAPVSAHSHGSFWTGHWPHVIIAVGGAALAFVIVPKWRRRD